jgi:hypothetical protein
VSNNSDCWLVQYFRQADTNNSARGKKKARKQKEGEKLSPVKLESNMSDPNAAAGTGTPVTPAVATPVPAALPATHVIAPPATQQSQIIMSGSAFTHLIPPITANIGEWAVKVRRVLEQQNVDFNDPKAAQQYVPFVMRNLPAYMLKGFRKNISLEDALQVIEKFDNRGGDLAERLAADKTMKDKPSMTFLMLIDENSKKMPDMDLQHLYRVAWKDLKNGLPHLMRVLLPTYHIKSYPTDEQLIELDDSWEQHTKGTAPKIVSAVTHDHTGYNPVLDRLANLEHRSASASNDRTESLILDRLTNLENMVRNDMTTLRHQVNAVATAAVPVSSYVPQNVQTNARNNGGYSGASNYRGNSNYRSGNGGGSSNTRGGNPRLSRKEQYDNRSDKRLCYYHFHFGKEGLKCDMPECPMKHLLSRLPDRVAR